MCPEPRDNMPGTVDDKACKRPLQLTSTVRSHSSVWLLAIMGLHLGLVCDIGLVDQHFTTVDTNLLLDAFQGFGPSSRHGHMGTLLGKASSHSGADSRRGASHHRNLAYKATLANLLGTAIDLASARRSRQPTTGIKVSHVDLKKTFVHLRARDIVLVKCRLCLSILEHDDRLEDLDTGHTTSENVDSEGVVARLLVASLLPPQSNPFVPGYRLVGRRHLNIPALDIRSTAELEGLDDDGIDQVPGVGRARDTVTADSSRTVNAYRNASAACLIDKLLGNPLGLAVTVKKLIRNVVNIDDSVLAPTSVRGREHAVGRDVVNSSTTTASKTKNLSGAANVGVSQSSNLNALQQVVLPKSKIDQVLSDTGHTGRCTILHRLGESHKTDDLCVGRVNQGLEEESTKVTGDTSQEDSLSILESTHRSAIALDVVGENRVSTKNSWEISLHSSSVTVAGCLDCCNMSFQSRSSSQRSQRDGEAKGLCETSGKVSKSQRVTTQVEKVMLWCDDVDGHVEGCGPKLKDGLGLDLDVLLLLGDSKMLSNGTLDSAGLNSVTTSLDHTANSAGNLQKSIGKNTSQITSSVHASVLVSSKGVHLECLGCCFWQVEVSSCQKTTTNVELAAHARFNSVASLIENVGVLGVCRETHRAHLCVVINKSLDVANSNLVRLTGTVDIEKACFGESIHGTANKVSADNLAVQPERAKLGELLTELRVLGKDCGQKCGGHEGISDAL
ncbi:hypothetical protein HG531_011218 [Fusarium graminearum]|nr:hypothetical protein HG531_011218 [Fusarium graminearum]